MEINEALLSQYAQSTALKSSTGQLGTDAFFKILAAQLQYQDPLESADNTQYIAQMAQFSTLEQMQNLNTSFQQMLLRQDLNLAGQMIGKEAALYVDEELIQGTVEGYIVSEKGILVAVDGVEYPFEKVVAVKESNETEEMLVPIKEALEAIKENSDPIKDNLLFMKEALDRIEGNSAPTEEALEE